MPKPVVAVDIDEVLAPWMEHYLKHHNLHRPNKLEWQDMTRENFIDVDLVDHFYEVTQHLHKVEPLPEAKELLERLAEKYELVIVTSRREIFTEVTRNWIAKHFPEIFKDILIGNLETPKSVLCKKAGAKVLIDDNLDFALECVERGIRVLLFGDYPWNKLPELPEGITRVKNWGEVLSELL